MVQDHPGGRAKNKTRDKYTEMRQAEPKWGSWGHGQVVGEASKEAGQGY